MSTADIAAEKEAIAKQEADLTRRKAAVAQEERRVLQAEHTALIAECRLARNEYERLVAEADELQRNTFRLPSEFAGKAIAKTLRAIWRIIAHPSRERAATPLTKRSVHGNWSCDGTKQR